MSLKADLYADQGTDFLLAVTLTQDDGSSLDLANCVFAGALKHSEISQNNSANLTITVANSLLGMVNISMNAAITANLNYGRYLYDVKMKNASNVTIRILEGIFTVTPQIAEGAL